MNKSIFLIIFFTIPFFNLKNFSQNNVNHISFIIDEKVYCNENLKVIISDSTSQIKIYYNEIYELLGDFIGLDIERIAKKFNHKNNKRFKIDKEKLSLSKFEIFPQSLKEFNWENIHKTVPDFCSYISFSKPIYFRYNKNLYLLVFMQQNSGYFSGSAMFYLYRVIDKNCLKFQKSVFRWIA